MKLSKAGVMAKLLLCQAGGPSRSAGSVPGSDLRHTELSRGTALSLCPWRQTLVHLSAQIVLMTMQLWWMKLTQFIIYNITNPFLLELLHAGASTAQPLRQELKPRIFTGEFHPCDPFPEDQGNQCAGVDKFNWSNKKKICLFCSSRKVIILDFLLQNINRKIEHQLFFQALLWCSVRYWQLNIESTTMGSVEQRLFYFSFWSIESIQLWKWVIAHALI